MNIRSHKALAIAAAALFMVVSGCTDTIVQPKSTITSANVFNDPNSYRAFLAKVYTGLAVSGQQGPAGQPDIQGIDEGFSQYLRLYWEAEELPTDEAAIAWGDVGLPEMNTQLWAASNSFVVAMYYRIYFQIGMANEFLRQTDDAALAGRNVTPELKAQIGQYRAEARFLRALSYWHGIDLFGSIPLVTENDPLGATPPKQSTRTDIYNYVVSELKAIKDSLPEPGPSTYGRATRPAASMLLAELYLNAGVYTGTADYADALTAAQDVINSNAYQLDPNYRHLFMADNNTSPEIIFAIPQDGLKTQTYGGVNFLVHAECGGNMNNADYGIDGCWWGIRLKPEAYNFYSAGDHRASYFYTNGQSLDVTSISNFQAGIAAPKFTNKTSTGATGSNPAFVDTDFPMFRLADAYLIYAEAVLRGGGGSRAQALAYVNALRERAYGGTSGDITDAQLTLPFILAERGRELLWEGHRRTDLVRFGEFTGGTYVWSWKGGTEAGTATEAFRDLYPLPESELVANPNLKQNPGY
ncbi:MAG TPA: RagB/SusD family nutrient uptake outer membrane protein [Gemmatimonadaceae bacterium]|nr:RagB/SusD family nutrient uptake outer membrane protein [Gemmatimonadaceae bacterium]